MQTLRLVTVTAVLGLLGTLTVPETTHAAEIRVLCSTGLKAVAVELFSQFEKTTNHKVVAQFGLAALQKQKVESGEPYDLVVVTPLLLDDLIKQGKVAADTRAVIARSGLGLLIKAGARKPEVGTVDAFKKTLLDAKSITYAKEGASGVLFAGVIQKLGIADALAAKTQYTSSGEQASENVVSGRAELAVLPLSEILPVKGAELGGLFPSEVQQYIVMAGGVNANAAQGAAARDLLKFLMAPSALTVIKTKGMERPAEPVQSKQPDKNGYIAQFSIEEIMESIVMPAAQAVWDSVAVNVTEKGIIETKPETDEDWEKLRWQAVTLVEATNLLIVPGRHAAPPGAKSENPGSELEPEQIQALLDKLRPAFVAHVHVLHEAAMGALRAIDARNIDGISEAGGTIDEACESCHLQFWYPNQK